MKNISNIAKFFIVCAVIFCIGIAMAAGGAAAGGVRGLEKIAHENKWINEGPGLLATEYLDVDDFHAVEANGDADVIILSEKYYSDSRWMDEHNVLDVESMLADNGAAAPESGHVLIVRGDRIVAPDVKVEDGVLKIDSEKLKIEDGIRFDFSNVPSTPVVYVFCDSDKLSAIKTDTFCGDVKVNGVTFKNAKMKSDSGDVKMYDVRGESASIDLKSGDADLSGKFSGPVTVNALSGDVDLSGTFKGPTNVDSTSGDVKMSGRLLGETSITLKSGDIDIDTELLSDDHTLDLKAASGEIEICEDGNEESFDDYPSTLKRGSGPNKIKIDSASGDIKLAFSMT